MGLGLVKIYEVCSPVVELGFSDGLGRLALGRNSALEILFVRRKIAESPNFCAQQTNVDISIWKDSVTL